MLLNLPSIILVLVKTLIILMLFLEQARGRPAWTLRESWCPRAPRWRPLECICREKYFCFYYIFLCKTFWAQQNLGGTKIGLVLPPNAP